MSPIYIYKDVQEYVPNENTIAYYKFENNLNDSSGNNRNFSMKSGSFTYWDIWDNKYLNVPQSAWTNWIGSFPFSNTSYTRCLWLKFPNFSKSWGILLDRWVWWSWWTSRFSINNWVVNIDDCTFTPSDYSKRYNYTIINSGGTAYLYVNAELQWSHSIQVTSSTVSLALNNAPDTNSSTYSAEWQLSELICESRARTAQEITDYYNMTKWNYS